MGRCVWKAVLWHSFNNIINQTARGRHCFMSWINQFLFLCACSSKLPHLFLILHYARHWHIHQHFTYIFKSNNTKLLSCNMPFSFFTTVIAQIQFTILHSRDNYRSLTPTFIPIQFYCRIFLAAMRVLALTWLSYTTPVPIVTCYLHTCYLHS